MLFHMKLLALQDKHFEPDDREVSSVLITRLHHTLCLSDRTQLHRHHAHKLKDLELADDVCFERDNIDA